MTHLAKASGETQECGGKERKNTNITVTFHQTGYILQNTSSFPISSSLPLPSCFYFSHTTLHLLLPCSFSSSPTPCFTPLVPSPCLPPFTPCPCSLFSPSNLSILFPLADVYSLPPCHSLPPPSLPLTTASPSQSFTASFHFLPCPTTVSSPSILSVNSHLNPSRLSLALPFLHHLLPPSFSEPLPRSRPRGLFLPRSCGGEDIMAKVERE